MSTVAATSPLSAISLGMLAIAMACCESRPPTTHSSGEAPRASTTASRGGAASAASHPRTTEHAEARRRMVEQQIAARGIRDERVLQAMRDVPRHWFVPRELEAAAYDDRPLPIGFEQTISQPYIVGLMTESLALRPTDRVLEIGTGSGYQAAVLSELTDAVYTIEIVDKLAARTIDLLKTRGYSIVRCRIGDGFAGWPEEAPFDAIIVTCAAPRPPPALVAQLKTGGRLCIPVDSSYFGQDLLVLTKRADGTLDRRVIAPVTFVPMTGEAQKRR